MSGRRADAERAWIVFTTISNGTVRRKVYLTWSGASRAVERDQDAGRAATVAKARITTGAVTR